MIFKMGEGYVPAYQVSATPFVTSSDIANDEIKLILFDGVTKFVTVKNTGAAPAEVLVSFTENGLTSEASNHITLESAEKFEAEVRCDRIFLKGVQNGSFELFAGLTQIPRSEFLMLTASNGFSGVG